MSRDGQREENVDAAVREELAQALRENGKPMPALADDLRLDADLGLSSFDVTTLLVRLTARLDAQHAEQIMADTEIATVGDLRRVFRPAEGGVSADRDQLAASRRRAEARRAATR
jgi:acyl carrier protein